MKQGLSSPSRGPTTSPIKKIEFWHSRSSSAWQVIPCLIDASRSSASLELKRIDAGVVQHASE